MYTPQSWCSSCPYLVISQISFLFLLPMCTGYYQMENSGNKQMKHKTSQTILAWSWHTCSTVTMDLESTLVLMIKSSYNIFQLKLLNFDPHGNLIGHVCSTIALCFTHSEIKKKKVSPMTVPVV